VTTEQGLGPREPDDGLTAEQRRRALRKLLRVFAASWPRVERYVARYPMSCHGCDAPIVADEVVHEISTLTASIRLDAACFALYMENEQVKAGGPPAAERRLA
jgi:hypothetical protein